MSIRPGRLASDDKFWENARRDSTWREDGFSLMVLTEGRRNSKKGKAPFCQFLPTFATSSRHTHPMSQWDTHALHHLNVQDGPSVTATKIAACLTCRENYDLLTTLLFVGVTCMEVRWHTFLLGELPRNLASLATPLHRTRALCSGTHSDLKTDVSSEILDYLCSDYVRDTFQLPLPLQRGTFPLHLTSDAGQRPLHSSV